jgi:hypothetical protein
MAYLLDEMLCLGARDEDVWCYQKRKTVELSFSDDVLDGFALLTPCDEFGVTAGLGVRKFLVWMGDQPRFIFVQNVE